MQIAAQLSVIIPTYNRREQLKYCLRSLGTQTVDVSRLDVTIVDNDSNDGTRDMVENLGLPFTPKLLRVAKKHRFESSRLRNCGLTSAVGDVIIFLDSDMVAPPTFLSQHVAYHQEAEQATSVLGKMLYLESNCHLASVIGRREWEPKDLGPSQLAGNTTQRFLELSSNLSQYSRPWDLCIGANFSLSRSALNKAGLFDEALDGDLPAAADCAYGLQMYAAGVRLVYGRSAIGLHQYNQPIHFREDPQRFLTRQTSVFAHEETVHRKWLPETEASVTLDLIRKKRVLNEFVSGIGAKFTLNVETTPLRRLTRPTDPSVRPAVSLLLFHDGTSAQLRQALDSINVNEPDPNGFEVIVIDPSAPSDEKLSNYDSSCHAIIQQVDADYALRYYAVGGTESPSPESYNPSHTHGRTLNEGQERRDTNGRAISHDRLRSILIAIPNAPVSIAMKSSSLSIPSNYLSHCAKRLRSLWRAPNV